MMRKETKHTTVARLVTGYFQERKNYSTWRTHGTNDYLLMLTLGGAGRIGWRNEVEVSTPYTTQEKVLTIGDLVLISPQTLHDYGTAHQSDSWELLWTHFLPHPHWRDLLSLPTIAPGIGLLTLPNAVSAKITDALWEMHQHANSGLVQREAFAMNALEAALLWCSTVYTPLSGAGFDARVAKTREMLREQLARPFALADLAKRVGLSPSRLSHLFHAQTGQTPGQFLEAERMARACQLLALTSRPIAAIAAEVGFENPFYFTLRFRKHTGSSPRDFRRSSDAGA